MAIVEYKAHPICTFYEDGNHRKRSGWYTCECGASSVWHNQNPVERCKHGYLDEHQWYDTLCPGAGIGGDDE